MGLFDGWTARASEEIADWSREPAGKVESNLPSVYTIADDPAMREYWADWKNPAALEPERYKLGEWEMLRMLGISPERTFDTPHAYAEPLHLLPHMHEVRVTARTDKKHFPTCGITREEWLALTDGGRLSLTQIYTEPEEDLRYMDHLLSTGIRTEGQTATRGKRLDDPRESGPYTCKRVGFTLSLPFFLNEVERKKGRERVLALLPQSLVGAPKWCTFHTHTLGGM